MNDKDRKRLEEIAIQCPFHETSEECYDHFWIPCRDAYWLISKLREAWLKSIAHTDCPQCEENEATFSGLEDRIQQLGANLDACQERERKLREACKKIPHPSQVPQWGREDWVLAAKEFHKETT